MKISYVTGNRGKFLEAEQILIDWELKQVILDFHEIQGDREEIIREKAKVAVSLYPHPLIVEDVSVCCPALGGLPGPYVKDFLLLLGEKGLAELILKYEDHSAEVICNAAYIEPGKEPLIFEGKGKGTIVMPRGELRHGQHSWNPLFVPEGQKLTMGEITLEEVAKFSMRRKALLKLKKHLQKGATIQL